MFKLYHIKQKTVEFLGVRIDNLNREEARQEVVAMLQTAGQHSICTPNSEMLVDASRDRAFRDILNASSLNICDSAGPELFSGKRLTRIPGVDFVHDICDIAVTQKKSIYIVGTASQSILQHAAQALQQRHPGLGIAGYSTGPQYMYKQGSVTTPEEKTHTDVLVSIQTATADIVLVALGHKKQETWIHQYSARMPDVSVFMGVGGAIDFISGSIPRAPQIIRTLRIESLYRLLKEPWRFPRVMKAIIVFPLVLIWSYVIRRKKNNNS